MAQRVVVTSVDDLDGVTEGADTVPFSLDGAAYEIDLEPGNAQRLRTALAPFIAAARKAPRAGRPVPSTAVGYRVRPNRAQSGVVRAWAKSAGIAVNDRGRVPSDVRAKWEAAGRPGA